MAGNSIIVFADGACLGNPGPGAAASIVADSKHVIELATPEQGTTNNRMELMAVIQALAYIESKKLDEVKCFCDSQYVLNGIQKWVRGWKRNGWKTAEGGEVKNRDLWEQLHGLVEKASSSYRLEWHHVKGHSGIPGNERCDEIATALASGQEVFLFDGPRSEYGFDLMNLESKISAKKSKPAKTTAATYYVSLVGGSVHRDKTWKECEARVKGVRAAKYKKVNSSAEEVEVLASWGVKI